MPTAARAATRLPDPPRAFASPPDLAPGQPPPGEVELPSFADGLEPEERRAFEAIRRSFEARLDPVDTGERLLVDAITACHVRRARLDAIEARLTSALLESRPAEGLPSLSALARVRSALAKEQAALYRDLARLYELRPEPIRYPGLNPARLRWLAERIEQGRLRPWAPPETEERAAAPTAGEPRRGAVSPDDRPADPPSADPPPVAASGHEAPEAPPTEAEPHRGPTVTTLSTAAADPAAGSTRRHAPEPSTGQPPRRPASPLATSPTRDAPSEPAAPASRPPLLGRAGPMSQPARVSAWAAAAAARPSVAARLGPRPESRSSIA
jgi:hypothetical protein